ncbi:MAG: peptidylprolyl isomerase [Bacteroidota bacterium]
MALIGRIRNNSWLLIVAIGLGLGGFLLMDTLSGQQSIFGQSQNVIGNIEGNKINANEFYKAEDALYSGSGSDIFGRRNALWSYFVEDALVQEEADALGLGVGDNEFRDLEFGQNLSPIIQTRFMNPNTRQVDRNQLNQIKEAIASDQLNPQYRAFWAHQQKEIVKERLQSKLNTLVSKAMYTPTWLAERYHQDQQTTVDFNYVRIPFSEIDDADVTLEDSDYQAFLDENKKQFMQDEETRKVNYVVFDVNPTPQDSADLREEMDTLIKQFSESTNDSLFVLLNEGSMESAFVKKESLNGLIADEVFAASVGDVIGPYEDAGKYNAVKVVDRMVLPDSVHSRHILLRASNQPELIGALSTADSLKNLLDNGVESFDSLALKFSQDASNAAKGGDLGNAFPGQMVKEFNDLIFYRAEINQVYRVTTQFGVHLVEVLDRTYINNDQGVKVGYIGKPIIPSIETQKERYAKALEFAGQNQGLAAVETAASEAGMEVVSSPPFKANDFAVGLLGPGQASRDIVKWAFSADVNDSSPTVYVYQDQTYFSDKQYVVTGLSNTQAANQVSVANSKAEIEATVRNRKKAEIIKSRITAGQNLAALASAFNSQIDTLRSVQFSAGFQPGLGNEPKVIAQAFQQEINSVSPPVMGDNGVYVVQLMNKTEAGTPSNIAQLRQQVANPAQGQVAGQLMQAMKKEASIKDYRSNFY